ncbi:hypothetical protein Micbo1qcDRAFT_166864 [Microdochium bolleyi]|uniref:Uncharacterized protein n=1 Tax=Microdochium bolleyi TaxID=196109 RepID=A0A136ITV6_9PEZI|nr:hypothetical protein Micbo1qcDRAFT_166864 [Microdochium bolleyi]
MATEMGRLAAFAASRSTTPLIRGSMVRSNFLTASRLSQPTASPVRRLSSTPMRSAASGWPSRGTQQARVQEATEIKKPDVAAYGRSPASAPMGESPNDNDFDMAMDLDLSLNDLRKTSALSEQQPPPLTHDLHCTPRLGRTVNLTKNVDVGRAFKLLAQGVAANKLHKTVRLQREHERPGLKRKRLKSERWQKRFKGGFKATVKRVRQLTAQGW